MIDYVPTEIVASSDLTFDDYYPSLISAYDVPNGVDDDGIFRGFEVLGTSSVLSNTDGIAVAMPELLGRTILAFKIVNYNHSIVDIDDPDMICYYIGYPDLVTINGVFCPYVRIMKRDIPVDIVNPFFASTPVKGDDIYFLYSLGQQLVPLSSQLSAILNYDIDKQGHTILSVLFISGFSIYMGWVLFKWVFPV